MIQPSLSINGLSRPLNDLSFDSNHFHTRGRELQSDFMLVADRTDFIACFTPLYSLRQALLNNNRRIMKPLAEPDRIVLQHSLTEFLGHPDRLAAIEQHLAADLFSVCLQETATPKLYIDRIIFVNCSDRFLTIYGGCHHIPVRLEKKCVRQKDHVVKVRRVLQRMHPGL